MCPVPPSVHRFVLFLVTGFVSSPPCYPKTRGVETVTGPVHLREEIGPGVLGTGVWMGGMSDDDLSSLFVTNLSLLIMPTTSPTVSNSLGTMYGPGHGWYNILVE